MDSMLSSSEKISKVTVAEAVTVLPDELAVVTDRVKSIFVYSRLGEAYIGVCAVTDLIVWIAVLEVFAE